MDADTQALIDRWILVFCEAPVLVDAELMRRVLADAEEPDGKPAWTLTGQARP